jgi:hypothetical protein
MSTSKYYYIWLNTPFLHGPNSCMKLEFKRPYKLEMKNAYLVQRHTFQGLSQLTSHPGQPCKFSVVLSLASVGQHCYFKSHVWVWNTMREQLCSGGDPQMVSINMDKLPPRAKEVYTQCGSNCRRVFPVKDHPLTSLDWPDGCFCCCFLMSTVKILRKRHQTVKVL